MSPSKPKISEPEQNLILLQTHTKNIEHGLITFNRKLVDNSIKRIIKMPCKYIEEIPNEFIKFMITRRIILKENTSKM